MTKSESKSGDLKTKKSNFPCPVCGSDNTQYYFSKEELSTSRKNKHEYIIYSTNTMPNFLRHCRCIDCDSSWNTLESVVMDSVKNKKGERIA